MNHQQTEEAVTADMQHLLEILSEYVNSDPYAPVREYVANAHDACIGRNDPLIRVWGEHGKIHIADNGCGMTRTVIRTAFTRIAGHHQHAAGPGVGKFGLGVLSAFAISHRLTVETRSAEEDQGWRLEWAKGDTTFRLQPITRPEPGTTATFDLSGDFREVSSEVELRDYVSKTFGLFTMPIRVGRSDKPVNAHHAWLAEELQSRSARLLSSFGAYDLLRQYCHMDVAAVYAAFEEDGTRVLLGIPVSEFAPLDLHKAVFFSRGVWVCGNLRAFFPENLAFVVGIVDHPAFALQIDREGFVMDRTFGRVRDSIESHILTFLEQLASEQPRVMQTIMRTHRTMLLAHSHRQPRLRRLLREHYCFMTSMGLKLWKDMVAFARSSQDKGSPHDQILYVVSEESAQVHVLPVANAKGYTVIFAAGGERALLEEIARAEGVHVADAAVLIDATSLAQVPEPFRVLGAMLAAPLRRHQIGNVAFFHLAGQGELPVMFQVVNVATRSAAGPPSRTPRRNEDVSARIEALMLNVAHPLIEKLAGAVEYLDAASLQRVADVLYCVAALDSPFDNMAEQVSDLIVGFLVETLGTRLGGRSSASPVRESQAKCFVGLPYHAEFDPVWKAVRAVLSGEPYYWAVVRADEDIQEPTVLQGLSHHIASSRRFIADISNMNSNVMLELGMMLQQDPRSIVILSDAETFERLPADLRGNICLVYPRSLRASESAMRMWFAENVKRNGEFTSMRGNRHG